MGKPRTLAQYRLIDLLLTAFLLIISQTAIYLAATTIFADQLYIVSPVAVITVLVMMRWGAYGLIHAALGGVLLAALSHGSFNQFLIYGLGNLAAGLTLLVVKGERKEKILRDTLLTMAFAASVQVLMQAGRAIVALISGAPFGLCLGFFTTDLLSLLFTVCIAALCRRVDGLFEEQRHYLKRINQ